MTSPASQSQKHTRGLRAIAFPSQNQSAEYINIGRGGDRLGLALVSKAERPFRLVQAAGSGVIFLRSYIFAVQGDRA
jgi:hypothetical protein